MTAKTPNLLGPALRNYFTDHLPRLRGMSPNTIQSYRDSLVLLLRFVACERKRTVADLDLTDIDPEKVLAFLSYLERDRKNGVTTRNVRISAIHAFFRYVGTRHPEQLDLVQRILGIPFKRARERAVEYMEYEEIDALLSTIDQNTLDERRDYALLATMFNTAARVQEIVDLRACDLQLTRPVQARIFGKGRKERFCPLWPQTAKTLRSLLQGEESGSSVRREGLSQSSGRRTDSLRCPLHTGKIPDTCALSRYQSRKEAVASAQHAPLSTLPDYVWCRPARPVFLTCTRSCADIVLTPCHPRAGGKESP